MIRAEKEWFPIGRKWEIERFPFFYTNKLGYIIYLFYICQKIMSLQLNNNDEFPNYYLFWDIIQSKGYLTATDENIKLADDWIQIWKPNNKFQRGGLWMWSNKLQKIRETTMSEYYGNGIVD